MRLSSVALVALVACGQPAPRRLADTPSPVPLQTRPRGPYTVTTVPLPGGLPGGIFLDYLAFDPATGLVWIPAGPTAAVDLVDASTGQLTSVAGWVTKELHREGVTVTVGPSAAAIGAGVVYIGNRGDSTVCAVDAKTGTRGACATFDAMPDGVVYVAETHEVWVTTPRDRSVRIVDARTMLPKQRFAFDGEPEGFAVDPLRHRVYTNLEDKDQTLAIDAATRTTVATWPARCGAGGPHGLRVSAHDGLLFVACSAKVETLDLAHDGAIVGSLETGDGIDDLEYVAATRTLYAASPEAAELVIAAVDARGALSLVEKVPTKLGGRNAVVDTRGVVYVAVGASSELLIATPRR